MKFSKILLLLVVVAVSIVSCKKDDDATVAFVLSNANIAGTHSLNYFVGSTLVTGVLPGGSTPVTITYNITADTFQAQFVFTEAGTYTLSGEFRITTTSSQQGTTPQSEIIVLNETGTYQVNDAAQTIVLIEQGGSLGESDVNTVTLFNETELHLTFGETYTEDGDDYVRTQESRLTRQ
jgi:hypothetical protein